MNQTLALLLNAYRELNARKLFWITLLLSGLVVAAFACIGINEKGMTILVWELPFPVNTLTISRETFYKTLFTSLGIEFWLSWLATILALVSTASIFPDFISSGTIDMELSKPIGRLRLFFTRYLTGLLFVALQVTIFCICSFLVIGIRGQAWEPGIFLAIPLVVCFFSYLYAFCAVLGLVTRSAIAALLLTLLIWLGLFSIHAVESTFLYQQLTREHQVASLERSLEAREGRLAELTSQTGEGEAPFQERQAEVLRETIASQREQLEETQKGLRTWTNLQNLSYLAKTILPKTSETIGLLERSLVDLAELPPPAESEEDPMMRGPFGDQGVPVNREAVQRELVERTRERSALWIIGTSLLFEFALLGYGAWIFCRRDF